MNVPDRLLRIGVVWMLITLLVTVASVLLHVRVTLFACVCGGIIAACGYQIIQTVRDRL